MVESVSIESESLAFIPTSFCWSHVMTRRALLFIITIQALIAFQYLAPPLDSATLFSSSLDTEPLSVVSNDDRYLSFTSYGRLSNNLIELANVIEIAKQTGHKILVYPLSADRNTDMYSLSWIQILNIEQIQQYLDPLGPHCVIRGLNSIDTDQDITNYMEHGIRLISDGLCNGEGHDSLWSLRDPASWSSNCRLLPWSHAAWIAPAMNRSLPLLAYSPDRAHCTLPTGLQCSQENVQYDLDVMTVQYDPLPFIRQSSSRLIILTGDVAFHTESVAPFHLSYNDNIKTLAGKTISQVSQPMLCMHVRRGDLSLVDQSQYIAIANELLTNGTVSDVFIITNGDQGELQQLHEGIGRIGAVGCDPNSIEACKASRTMKAAIEQQACAQAHIFIGSPASTFTQIIINIRQQQNFPPSSSIILQ